MRIGFDGQPACPVRWDEVLHWPVVGREAEEGRETPPLRERERARVADWLADIVC